MPPSPDKDESEILAETGELRRLNEAMAYANYMGNISVLRADVLLKMESIGISPSSLGWMYFSLGGDESGGLLSPLTDLVIICTVEEEEGKNGEKHKRPRIRIFKSERFDTPLGDEYLTYDVTVDHEGDSQYFMDTVLVKTAESTNDEPLTDAGRKSMDATVENKAFVPFFRVNSDGELMLGENFFSFTSPFRVAQVDEDGSRIETMPFGHYKVLSDAIYALDVARSLFDEVRFLNPTHHGQAKDQ